MNTVDPESAFSRIKSNQRIVTSMAAAEPYTFFSLLSRFGKNFTGLDIHCANPTYAYPCFADPSFGDHVTLNTMFLTKAILQKKMPPHVQYVPQHLSQWSRNILTSPVDVFWGVCTPPNDEGVVSLGVSACYETEIIKAAKYVVLEVNELMPFTWGNTLFSVSDADFLIKNTHSLNMCEPAVADQTDDAIADFVSEFVHDGSTIQLGIGGIPNALGKRLTSKKNLGIHTELITDSMVDLVVSGAVDGSRKEKWKNRVVGSFVFGTQKLYDFVHQNKNVELYPSSQVNNPYVIAQNPNVVSINSAIEVDISGQVCSESLGHVEISGVGGASETHVGAQLSKNGRGIIALHSATSRGKSKIVSMLTPGAKVTLSRNDIDTVVTEYGVAQLKGKSVRERILAMVSIAHPSVREQLMFDAQKYGYV